MRRVTVHTNVSAFCSYAGGKTKGPSYEQVCSGNTGHAEAVQFQYDPKEVEYKDLV